jgi:hypothetical protein
VAVESEVLVINWLFVPQASHRANWSELARKGLAEIRCLERRVIQANHPESGLSYVSVEIFQEDKGMAVNNQFAGRLRS